MKIYHATAAGVVLGDHTDNPVDTARDQFVPLEEVNDPDGRYINCPACAEALAQSMGGTLRRPQPPLLDDGVME